MTPIYIHKNGSFQEIDKHNLQINIEDSFQYMDELFLIINGDHISLKEPDDYIDAIRDSKTLRKNFPGSKLVSMDSELITLSRGKRNVFISKKNIHEIYS